MKPPAGTTRTIRCLKKKRIPVWSLMLAVLLAATAAFWSGTSAAQTGTFCVPTGGEAIQTNKLDFEPGETVFISGTGFQPACDVYVRVTRPNGTVVKGDGTFAPGMDIATTDGAGNFTWAYIRQGNSISGEHVVDALDGEINVVAFAIFHNPEPPGGATCNFTVDPTLPAEDLGTGTFKSIQSAVTYLPNPGPCTITVLPGTYYEAVNIVSRNTLATEESQRITIHAPYGAVNVAPIPSNSVGFTLTDSKFITVTGFTVTGNNVYRGFSLSGAVGSSNWDITIDGNIVFNVGTPAASGSAGISIGAGNPRTWIVNNLVRNNARGGIDLANGSGPSYIVNNTIHGNGWNGVTRASASGANAAAFLINNLVTGNGVASDVAWGRWGIYQSGSGSATLATLRNNMLFNNGVYSGGTLSSGGDISTAGILDSTDANNYTTNGRASTPSSPATGIAGCTFADCSPSHSFTEIYADTADFILLKTTSQISPAIDKGANTFFESGIEWVPAEDLYGGSRMLDGDGDGVAMADIGYHEVPGEDTAPPDTIIDSGPSGIVNSGSAVFRFRATEPGSTFQCQLDSDPVAACDTRTVTYNGLPDGAHAFTVWATDSSGNADPSPAVRSWTIDTVPPDTVIDSSPPLQSNTDGASFTFRSTETGGTFECSIDGLALSACTSPKTYTGMSDGSHTFRVRAIDQAGNADASPAEFTWSVSNFPNTSITVTPPNVSNGASAYFGFTSDKIGSTFECSLDSASFASCSSPVAYSGLQDGVHAFSVRAVDAGGRIDPSPAAYSWVIDTFAPDTIIDSGPTNTENLFLATFGFRSTENGSIFECSLDGTPFSACSNPKSYAGLAPGQHSFRVRSIDLAGNADPSPAIRNFNWSVDTSTLTIVQDVADIYATYNQIIYFVASVSSSVGLVNEGNVVFTVKKDGTTVIGPITSAPVTNGNITTYSVIPAGTPVGIYAIEARYSGGPNFQTSTGTGTLTISKRSATIWLGNLTQNYDGTPKSVTVTTNPAELSATVAVTYNDSTTPPTNPGSYSVRASITNPNYMATDATGILNIVGRSIPTITWSNPADIVYPAPLSAAQLNAVADVQGSLTYSPPAGTVLNAGMSQILRADFVPLDTENYINTFKTIQINILKASQTIDFGPLPDRTFGDPDFVVSATATSGLPVSFTAIGSCAIAGDTVHISAAGNCVVTASQIGDANYNLAQSVARTFNIAKGTASLTLNNLVQAYDGSPKQVAVTTDPPGLEGVSVVYDGSPLPPAEASGYPVIASLSNPDYQAQDAAGTLTILRADAGPDQTVAEAAGIVAIGGAASYGASYEWAQIAGPPVSMNDPSNPMPSFYAPSLEGGFGSQVVTFRLTVSGGGLSVSDTLNVTVINVNNSPVAEAGLGQTVNENAPVTLSGNNSYDPDSDPVTYLWTQTGGPEVSLDGAGTATATFIAPLVSGGISGSVLLTFRLAVSDGALSDEKTVSVTVEQVNHPPTADAGPDQAFNEGSLVTLNAGGADPDGDPLTYTWTQIGGPTVTLSDSQSATPSFTAPPVGPGGGTLAFQLVASDGLMESLPDAATIAILNVNDPPVCAQARPIADIPWPKNHRLAWKEVDDYMKHHREHGDIPWPRNPELTHKEAREFLEYRQANTGVLWPPNHKLVPVRIKGVTDPNNDGAMITVIGVTQDEPVKGLGDGDTGPDAVLQGDTVLLRAERSGKGNGRVYMVHFTAEDGNGGSCTGSVRVTVPKDRDHGGSAIDDGQLYISTIH